MVVSVKPRRVPRIVKPAAMVDIPILLAEKNNQPIRGGMRATCRVCGGLILHGRCERGH